ncbi:hypothetical protein [Streptomyces rishiriensis]|uniref:hypothetical protein n=1 Tax=Streptomyces rishiriensis TaxID=68264 RepID=UPI0037D0F03D
MLVIEIHVPLSPAPDLPDDAYPYPWIEEIEDFLAGLEETGEAEIFDEGVEHGGYYVFFVTGAPEPALLEAAARAAALPGVPAGAFAVVSDDPEAPEDPEAPGAPGTGAGRGRRADLPPPPPATS